MDEIREKVNQAKARNKERQAKKKDRTLLIVVIVLALAFILIGIPIISPIVNKMNHDSFINDLTVSLNDANESREPVIAVMDGKEYELDEYSTQYYYVTIVDLGTGMKIEAPPKDDSLILKFPDGTTLEFREGAVTSGPRKGRMGTFVYYNGPKGQKYQCCSDMFTFASMKKVVEDQLYWEDYEREEAKKALEERVKEIEERLGIQSSEDAETGNEEP